jgi:aminoglycoside phosphotransferase (APT) family kinase protein
MHTNVWDAERIVEADQARQLIREQFPDIECRRLELFGVGWDNTAYLIDNEFVFRFPRRQIAVAPLETEAKALPYLADRLALAVPRPLYFGQRSETYDWPFLGYRVLPGQTACRADLTIDERERCIEPLADFLRALHAVPIEESRAWGLPDDPFGKCNAQKRIVQVSERLDQIDQLDLFPDTTILRELAERTRSIPEPPYTTTVHGDLYFRHLLVDSDHKLTGVIDWGDLHIGTAAADLSVVHSFFPQEMHGRFRQIYGEPITAEAWELARLRAIFVMSILLLYGHDTRDEAAMREAGTALQFIAADS